MKNFFCAILSCLFSFPTLLGAERELKAFSIKDKNDKKIYGFKNRLGKLILKPRYTDAEDFQGGFARVKSPKGWGVIDVRGKVVIPLQFKAINPGYTYAITGKRNPVMVQCQNNKWGFFTPKGKEIIPCEYDEFVQYFYLEKGIDIIRGVKSGKLGILDVNGKVLVDFLYDQINNWGDLISFGKDRTGLIPVKKDDKWGLVNAKGELALPLEYEEMGYYMSTELGMTYYKTWFYDMIPVKKSGLWTMYHKKKKFLSDFRFNYIYTFFWGDKPKEEDHAEFTEGEGDSPQKGYFTWDGRIVYESKSKN